MKLKPQFEKVAQNSQSYFVSRHIQVASFEFSWHFHPEYELTLILNSSGRRFVGDNIDVFRPNDLVLLGPNLPHTWYSNPDSEQPAEAIVVQFSTEFVNAVFPAQPELKAITDLLQLAARGVAFNNSQQLASRISQLNELSGIARLTEFLNIVDQLALTSGELKFLSSSGFVPNLAKSDWLRIDQICSYINEHYTRALSEHEVAEVGGMTTSTFSRFFRRSTGHNFVSYINELRVSLACKLLVESDLSVTAIALQVGYNNLSNFNRQFMRSKNMSPRHYRQQFRLKWEIS